MEKPGVGRVVPSALESHEPSEKGLTVALAEFNALRALIATRFQIQSAALFGALTAISVIAGLAIKDKADHQLVLLIPLLASGVSILYTEQVRRISITGTYIRLKLWPYLATADEKLPSWETWWLTNGGLMGMVGDAPGNLLLLAASVGSLVYGVTAMGLTLVWWLGSASTTTAIGFVLATVREGFRRRHDSGPDTPSRRETDKPA